MNNFLIVFVVFCNILVFSVARAQVPSQLGYSTIVFQLRGDYPEDLVLDGFGYGNALYGQGLLDLQKKNDSTYYTSFQNPVISSYYLVLNGNYFSTYIAPNRNDTLIISFDSTRDIRVDYRGDNKALFDHSAKYVAIMENYFFGNKEIDSWTRKDFAISNAQELLDYTNERISKKNVHLHSENTAPAVLSVGKEVIDVSELGFAMRKKDQLPDGASLEGRFDFYRTIFRNNASLLGMDRPMSKIVYDEILSDSLLNLPNLSKMGPHRFEQDLDAVFQNSLGESRQAFFEHLIAIAYMNLLEGGKSLSASEKLDVLSYFTDSALKASIIYKSEMNSKNVLTSNVNYLPFDKSEPNVFKSLISRYKGKIILIDFWATWCGPCIQGFNELRPLKEKFANNKDIVFLYLTDESSNYDSWKGYTERLEGEHYLLSKEQFDLIYQEKKLKGLPHYMLIDSTGNIKYSQTMPKELLSTIERWIQSSR